MVERRKCHDCGTCAWASDNWRETSVFNYNNKYLLEVPILYNCLAQFIGGTPIQNYFFALFQPLRTNVVWLSEDGKLAARYAALMTLRSATCTPERGTIFLYLRCRFGRAALGMLSSYRTLFCPPPPRLRGVDLGFSYSQTPGVEIKVRRGGGASHNYPRGWCQVWVDRRTLRTQGVQLVGFRRICLTRSRSAHEVDGILSPLSCK